MERLFRGELARGSQPLPVSWAMHLLHCDATQIQQLLNHIERVSAKQAAALSERQSSQVTLVNYKDVTRRVLYTLLAILCAKYDR